MREQTYIALPDYPFDLERTHRANFGIFFFIRLLWSYRATGKKWQRLSWYTLAFFIISPLCLALDTVLITLLIVFEVLKWITKFIAKQIKKHMKTIRKNLIAPLLKGFAIILLVLFIIYLIQSGQWKEVIKFFEWFSLQF